MSRKTTVPTFAIVSAITFASLWLAFWGSVFADFLNY